MTTINTNQELIDKLKSRISIFFGKTQDYLIDILYVNSSVKNKGSNYLISKKMIEYSLSTDDRLMLNLSNFSIKTIRINIDNSINESMSFPNINFIDLINQEWVESDLYRKLKDETFMFFIFKYIDDELNIRKLIFDKIVVWKMPIEDIDICEKVWTNVKNLAISGLEIMQSSKGKINNLPKQKDNSILHVRPHARNASDVAILPDGREITKQCFWLNSTYIEKIISQND